jgi:ribosomal protein S12 methylthiotransferase
MKETVCVTTLGCPKNLVDSEVILGLLTKQGYSLTSDASEAEILIVNTCAFIEDATKEAIDTILHLARYKREGRCRRLVVCGCLAQRYGKALEKELPEVDLFVGTGAFQNIPDLLVGGDKASVVAGPSFLYDHKTPRILSTPSYLAYLKIAEGCSKACTFCTVPSIRGPYRSRRRASILYEAKNLADQGVRELILIAQDTTAYGEDLAGRVNLESLLKGLTGISGLRWIRLLYAYPRSRYLTRGILELIAHEEKICPYLDVPIQHIDDQILKRMGRLSKAREVRGILGQIRTFFPELKLRTSLIVGFPGETDSQFKSLLGFIREIEFDHLGAFQYSAEEGTPAARLPNAVPEEVKRERLQTLMEIQRRISLRKNRAMVGTSVEILVEGPDGGKDRLRGRLRTQAPEIDGSVILRGSAQPGEWVQVRITGARPYDLIGRIES